MVASGESSLEQAGRLLLIRERFAWMGAHSGYDPVFEHIESRWPGKVDSVWRTRSVPQNVAFAPLARLTPPNTPFYNGDSMAAELRAIRHLRRHPTELLHVTFVENNLRLLARQWTRSGCCCIGTAHQPAEWWRSRHRHPELVSGLDALLVTSTELQSYFAPFLPERVHRIRLGVDTAFFCPASPSMSVADGPPRCLFSGVWLRDLDTLEQVIGRVQAANPEIHFDLVVPEDRRNQPPLQRIAQRDRVTWHANLTDEELRDVYRQSSLLLLPLTDSAANTALVESIACGLPVVTTEVGGVRDYTEPAFADVRKPGDVEGISQAVLRLSGDPEERRARSRAARDFALRALPWEVAAEETMAIYREVLNARPEASRRSHSL